MPRSRWTAPPSSSILTSRRGRPGRSNMVETARGPVPFRPYTPGTQPPYDAPAYGSTHKRHPQESLVRLPHTITEITGPRFNAVQFPAIPDLSVVTGKSALGERIIVHGRLTVYGGRAVPRTLG